ncbi:MAG: hypothetical protein RLZZ618_1632 [Pseudomonadota bacterium]|jgi:methionyl-tRNA formyltransferase
MRLVFAGTPEFAQVALDALIAAGHEVVLVMSKPDQPARRGLKLQASPVKQTALAHGIAVSQPRSLRLDGKYPDDARAAREALLEARADLMVVAAYGLILPQWVLDLPPRGCLNIHASLLPRWRGAAPIHRAIEAGDELTGITLMQMDAGLDTGDMLHVASLPIGPGDSTASLHDRLAALGGQLLVQALAGPDAWKRTPQPEAGVTYAHKIEKAEAPIDWALPAAVIERRIRAFDAFPGATTALNGEAWKVWRAEPAGLAGVHGAPGTVLEVSDAGVRVACGEGAVRLTELQRAGGKRLPARQFLQSQPVQAGQVLAPREV